MIELKELVDTNMDISSELYVLNKVLQTASITVSTEIIDNISQIIDGIVTHEQY